MIKLGTPNNFRIFSILLTLLVPFFLSCESGGSSSNTPPSNNNEGSNFSGEMKDIKQDILSLIEGTYAEVCTKMIDDELQMPGTGSPLQINANSGMANWGFGSIDMLSTPSTDYGVVVAHEDAMFASKFDLVDPKSMERLVVLGISISDPKSIAATVTDDRQKPKLSDLCVGNSLPKGFNADIWGIMNKYYSGSVSAMNCINLQTFQQFKWNFSMSDSKIVLGPHTILAGSARSSENLFVQDFEPQEGITFSVSTLGHEQFSLFLDPKKKLKSVQWMDANSVVVGCSL